MSARDGIVELVRDEDTYLTKFAAKKSHEQVKVGRERIANLRVALKALDTAISRVSDMISCIPPESGCGATSEDDIEQE